MDLDRLRAFQVICEEGSVSRAAVRLFRTQPAVSMQLAALEAEAGARLVTRNGRGVVPTAAGQRLLACAAELFRAHERLREAWAGEDVGGDLHVASSDTVARHFLPPVLRALVRQRPEARLHLVQSATPESHNRLRRGEVEVAFLLRPVADPRLAAETVLRYQHVAAYPRSRCRDGGPPSVVDPAELASGPLVLLARGTQTRHLVDEAFRAKGIVPERVLEVGSVSIQKEMVRCGLGVGIVPSYAVEPGDRLRVRSIANASLREIAVAWRTDLPLTGTADAFLALTRAEGARRTSGS
jgi:LysR family nitrogen assimilation transcriptional regulator